MQKNSWLHFGKVFCAFTFTALVWLVTITAVVCSNQVPREPVESVFVCAIECMDGRGQEPIGKYLKDYVGRKPKQKRCPVYVDTVTEAGPARILAEDPVTGDEKVIVKNIRKRVEISVKVHNAKTIAIVGHLECAGDPVKMKQTREEAREKAIVHLRQARKTIQAFGFEGVEIIALLLEADFKTVTNLDE